MIEMGIETTIFKSVLDGRKTIEGRLRTAKFVTLRIGDTISLREDVWKNDRLTASNSGQATAVVTETKFYNSFADMFTDIDYHDAVPTALVVEDAIALYRQFYTLGQEFEHGVVAIRFKLL